MNLSAYELIRRRRTLVPVVKFDPHFDVALDRTVTPFIARLLPGPDIGRYLQDIDSERASNIRHFIANGFSRVFAYVSDVFMPPETLLILDHSVTPGSMGLFTVSNIVNGEDKNGPIPVGDSVRRRLLWFIYDVLRTPSAIDSAVHSSLLIPHWEKERRLQRILASPAYVRLRTLLRRHSEMNHLMDVEQRALTQRHSPDNDARDELLELVGRTPSVVGLNRSIAKRHDLRLQIFEISSQISETFHSSRAHGGDLESVVHPYVQRRLANSHRGIVMHLEPSAHGEMTWTLWRLPWRNPIAMSTEGPVELLHQGELVLYGDDAFENWLDRTILDGVILYNPEPYELLDEQPLLWDSEKFRTWAPSLELEESPEFKTHE